MPDCTAQSKLILDYTMLTMAEIYYKGYTDVNIDDAVSQMMSEFPELSEKFIIDSIYEATTRQTAQAVGLKKALQKGRSEARILHRGEEKYDLLEQYLEEGAFPTETPKPPSTTPSVVELRKSLTNVNKWVSTADPKMTVKLNQQLEKLNEKLAKIESGEEEVRNPPKLHEELQPLMDKINEVRAKIKDVKDIAKLESQIAELQKHLDEGTLPTPKPRKKITRSEQVEALREVKKDLQDALAKSPQAKKKALQESIDALDAVIASGEIPQKVAVKDIEEDPEIVKLEYEKHRRNQTIRSMMDAATPKTFWQKAGFIIDFNRMMMLGGEASFIGRQGGWSALTHPVIWYQNMLKAFRSIKESEAVEINRRVFNDPLMPVAYKAKLPMMHEGDAISSREELIMNTALGNTTVGKIPVLGQFAKISNQTAVAWFNSTRLDLFKAAYNTLGRSHTMTAAEAQLMASYISISTGRGELGKLEPAAFTMNRMLLAPRWVMSRFQLLIGYPMWKGLSVAELKAAAKGDFTEGAMRVRIYIAKEYLRVAVGLALLQVLGALLGAEEERDPRSADFGKLKFGNTRLDPGMGLAQPLVLGARVISGKTKTQGEVRPLRGPDVEYGKQDMKDVLFNFGRSKASIGLGIVLTTVTGETMDYQTANFYNTFLPLFYPITYEDIYKVAKEEGMAEGAALGALGFLGMGLQTYQPRPSSTSSKQTKAVSRQFSK